jgi:hypothetical protein
MSHHASKFLNPVDPQPKKQRWLDHTISKFRSPNTFDHIRSENYLSQFKNYPSVTEESLFTLKFVSKYSSNKKVRDMAAKVYEAVKTKPILPPEDHSNDGPLTVWLRENSELTLRFIKDAKLREQAEGVSNLFPAESHENSHAETENLRK